MKAVIAGAGPIGLATAILLAQDGWEVRVFEKDSAEPPDDADEIWSNWERGGVAQFRQPHIMMPRFKQALDLELPAVRDRIDKLGGRHFNLIELLPRTVTDRSPRPLDQQFETVVARRPILEAAFAQVARQAPRVEIVRGTGVLQPIAGDRRHRDVPHVAGVRTSAGEDVFADLVVDAMGRRSKLPDWVTRMGGRPPHEEATDAGFAYYARHFRSVDGGVPEFRGPMGGALGTIHALTMRGDNECWTVGLIPMAGDTALKALRHADVWSRVASSVPHVAHWLDGEPLTDVLAMGGVLDRYRRFVVGAQPVVTGMVAIGDAWACTNPTAGRGLSLGLRQAIALRDVLREAGDDPFGCAVRLDEVTEATLTPWYRDQVDRDRQRAAEMTAALEGRQVEGQADPARQMQAAFLAGAAQDPELARALLETMSCLALPQEMMARPGFVEKVLSFVGSPVPQVPAPARSELLRLVGSEPAIAGEPA